MRNSTRMYTTPILLLLCLAINAFSQTVPMQNDWDIPSDTSIKIMPGTYSWSDIPEDGVIQIMSKQNIVIDADSVILSGGGLKGFGILIENSNNIVIKNFLSIKKFFYAVKVKNSSNITIQNCRFTKNKLDSFKVLNALEGIDSAHGGGILMDSVSNAMIDTCVLTFQNDGIALYHCDSVTIQRSKLIFNSGFGIRMYRSDSCWIRDNDCSNNFRWTDQAGAAGISLAESNHNLVEYNLLNDSESGFKLTNFFSTIPARNIIRYNTATSCLNSGISAVFSQGNRIFGNTVIDNNFGLYLGFSFETLVDSNVIRDNHRAGIAVPRGHENTYRNNEIHQNRIGIRMYKGPSAGSHNDTSQHNLVENCNFSGNSLAMELEKTQLTVIRDNRFEYNRNDILFRDSTQNDSILDCVFHRTAGYFLQNLGTFDVYTANNNFTATDNNLLNCKIYDKQEDPGVGEIVLTAPLLNVESAVDSIPATDLAEGPAIWRGYGADGIPTIVAWDSAGKHVGASALKITAFGGADVLLHYWPEEDKRAQWDVSAKNYLYVWYRSQNSNEGGFQTHWIRLGNYCGGYFQYTPVDTGAILNHTQAGFRNFIIDLEGDSLWSRDSVGDISLSAIEYIQINTKTAGFAFELTVDGLEFLPTDVISASGSKSGKVEPSLLPNVPNPFGEQTTIRYFLPYPGEVSLNLVNMQGQEVSVLTDQHRLAGIHHHTLNAADLPGGVYFCQLQTSYGRSTRKVMLIK